MQQGVCGEGGGGSDMDVLWTFLTKNLCLEIKPVTILIMLP